MINEIDPLFIVLPYLKGLNVFFIYFIFMNLFLKF